MTPTLRRLELDWMRRLTLVVQSLALAAGIAIFGIGHLVGFDSPTARWGISALVVVLVVLACWRRGGARAWLVLMVGLVVFLEARAVADNLGFPLHTDDLRRLEQLLFLGAVPSHVLQELLFTPGEVGLIDRLSVAVHWSYFFVPYVVLFCIWLVRPDATHRLAYPLVLTFAAGLAIYVLLPATPPWLASFQPGAPRVYRIVALVGRSVSPATYDQINQNIGDPNPVAALPSVHFAVTFMLFLYALDKGRVWKVLAAAYSLAMLWALVYLGEHYVVDCILGGLVAWVVWRGYQRYAGRPVRRSP